MRDLRKAIAFLATRAPESLRRFIKQSAVGGPVKLWLSSSSEPKHENTRARPKRRAARDTRYARALEAKLWGGFSRYALRDLEEIKRSTDADRTDVAYAALALARWYAAESNWQRACENLSMMQRPDRSRRSVEHVLLESECLVHVGERASARALVSEAMQHRPNNASLYLAMANTYAPLEGAGDAESDSIRLAWINRIYASSGLAAIAKANSSRPLAFDNLTATATGSTAPTADQPRVTVIMPIYNCATTLAVSLDSVLRQTWQNLEVIAVDDCSPDESFAIAEDFARRDARVRAARLDTNRGSYGARNRGLALATGDFVTTHDADDWSHPQKIEQQVRNAIEDGNFVGNLSTWIRVLPSLWVNRSLWKRDSYVHTNTSSLLARRDVLTALGGWDRVRITADTELVWRLTRYGDRKPTTLRETVPMSIALDGGSSLTNAGTTHFRTIYHGVRREYREAAADWHSAIDTFDQLKLSDSAERPFPAPGMILCDRDDPVETDLLVVTDFNGGEPIPALDDIQAALSRRRTVAVFHWRRYDADTAEPLNAEIRKLARTSGVRIIAPGERVRAKTVVIGDPAVLQYAIDLCPRVAFDSLIVRGDPVTPHAASEALRYDPIEVRANLRKLFGTEGVWTLNAATDLLP